MLNKVAKKEKVKVAPTDNGIALSTKTSGVVVEITSADDNKTAKKIANDLKKSHNESLTG